MESELLVARMIGGNSARFEVEDSANQYWVLRFSGVEAISELFELQIEVTSRFVTVDELVGAHARLKIAGIDRSPRAVHGLICRAEYVGELPPRSLYKITLVPDLWRMRLRTTSRIFQRATTPEILHTVLKESGIAHEFRLAAAYEPRDYCVQYRESDLAFIRRLMEQDGLAFYFEHEEQRHTLVISDINTGRVPIEGDPELQFRGDDRVRRSENVRRFSLGQEITPAAAVSRDHDLHAGANVEGRSALRGDPRLELYDAPVGARARASVDADARNRLDAARVTGLVAVGTSDCPRLVPGHAFTLAGHPRGELDGSYHVLRTTHRGEQSRIVFADAELVYDNDFVAIPTAVPYRPPSVTLRPSIRGVQTATVVGPAGEEIYVDEQGRVKVQFHWDRAAPFSEESSCWVRVSQAWAGPGYGSMFIPRVGHEVLVEFIEGDPSRPIITGRIYDGTRPPPYPLPDEKTKSTIKSESSPGGGGFNELRFEDAAGDEEIFVHAQLDMSRVVERDDRTSIGDDKATEVGRDQDLNVGRHRSTSIGGNQTTTVVGLTETIVGGDQLTSVHGSVLTVAAIDEARAVGRDQHVQIQGTQTIEVGLDRVVTVLGVADTAIGGDRQVEVAGGDALRVAGALTIDASSITFTAGGSSITLYPGGIDITTGGFVTVNGALVTINMDGG